MTTADILILLAVAVWAVIAVKRGWKDRKNGCGGNCSGCTHSCTMKKEQKP